MIRVTLNRLLSKLSYETDTLPVSVEDIAKETGYHRNSITRLLKEPEENTTTALMDAVLKVIFNRFRKVPLYKDLPEQELAKKLLEEFMTFTPGGEPMKLPRKRAPKAKVAAKQKKTS